MTETSIADPVAQPPTEAKKTIIVLVFDGAVPAGTVFSATTPSGAMIAGICNVGATYRDDMFLPAERNVATILFGALMRSIIEKVSEVIARQSRAT